MPGYTELKALGSGGFGDVVLARHDRSGTMVAIKYLHHDLMADPEFAAMFRDEAAVLASLDDPNVVRLYEYIESPAGAAIVMELVDGSRCGRSCPGRARPRPRAFVSELRTVAWGAYGKDWEDRGRSNLGEATLLLAALWPSGAPPAVHGSTMRQVRLPRSSQGSRQSRHRWHLRHLRHEAHLGHLRRPRLATAATVAAAVAVAIVSDSGAEAAQYAQLTGRTVSEAAAGRGLSNRQPLSMPANSARRPKRYCRSTRPARRWRGSPPGTPEARSHSRSADCARSGRLAW